ncbi:MAG: dolichyl-P-Man:Man(5)GlcNAc(2)-PP-dolichol alpha-1,3-mannosyltransferase [Bathelium mastoideum]|nr:MAG: dolichyl-P-Man:Man(5)GlcNAc(2)-PP-dolichol alpha-1,3-mannosyltransferase [Bathelium mastoideum]KAI9690451.1 MAG: dolichyl-P-Man:Man(5)GlcNAc(2)-PP-dolichol alpha-1,3-mannosyltransferase [Bathelium mastoideum]
MSKLSDSLKALISAPRARPGVIPAPPRIESVYRRIQQEATSKNVGLPSWLALTTGATMTMNSPDSMITLYKLASSSQSRPRAVEVAELMREIGLKCISFNGVPRTINMLNAFRASLPSEVASSLSTTPTRTPNTENISSIRERGRVLWDSIYRGFETKLVNKLAEAHPDLPVHILNSEYGSLLSDPPRSTGATVGRITTSIVAVACLRAQTGVGPQVISHVFGLRKAAEDGTWKDDVENEESVKWLASDDGNKWILEKVDELVETLGEGTGSSYAPGMKPRDSKL